MQSRVGGAAISVPPDVTLNLVELPKSLSLTRGKDVPKFAAHIKGPKGMCWLLRTDELEANVPDWNTGEMTLELPSFLNVNHDTTTLKTTLSVLDPEVPAQRAMWGMCLLECCRAFRVRI
jgi:large subunit ribosomal protein L6